MGEVMGVRLVWFGVPLSEGRQVTAINTGLATGPWKGKSKWRLELSCPGSDLGSGVRPRTPPPCLPLEQAQVARLGRLSAPCWPLLRLTCSRVVYAQPLFGSGKDFVSGSQG